MRHECALIVDGETAHNGAFLPCTISNGTYMGGSFSCASRSKNDDGIMEVCLIKAISRPWFIRLLRPHKAGRRPDDPRFADCLVYRRGKTIEIQAPPGFLVSPDGEIVEHSHFTVETLPRAVRFIVPSPPP